MGSHGSGLSWSFIFPTLERNRIVFTRKALHGFFICIFSCLTYLKKLVFSKRDLLRWKFLGSSDQRKVLASLSLFLKSEKIPAVLCVGKGFEYRPFRDFRPVPSPTSLGHRSQIPLRPSSYLIYKFTWCVRASVRRDSSAF